MQFKSRKVDRHQILFGFHAERPFPKLTQLAHCGDRRTAPDYTTTWHQHLVWEFYEQLEGYSLWETEHGAIFHLQPGDFFAMPPGVAHRLVSIPPEVPRFLYFGIDISHPQSPLHLVDTNPWKPYKCQVAKSNSSVTQAGKRIIKEVSQITPLQEWAIANSIDYLIVQATRLISPYRESETSSESFIHPTVIKIMQRIADQPGINWNLEALSIEYKLNSKYLSNLFKRESGRGFQKFIMNQRIQRAYQLLRESKKSITELAYELGFSSSQHFATAFKNQSKNSPREYRELHQKKI